MPVIETWGRPLHTFHARVVARPLTHMMGCCYLAMLSKLAIGRDSRFTLAHGITCCGVSYWRGSEITFRDGTIAFPVYMDAKAATDAHDCDDILQLREVVNPSCPTCRMMKDIAVEQGYVGQVNEP